MNDSLNRVTWANVCVDVKHFIIRHSNYLIIPIITQQGGGCVNMRNMLWKNTTLVSFNSTSYHCNSMCCPIFDNVLYGQMVATVSTLYLTATENIREGALALWKLNQTLNWQTWVSNGKLLNLIGHQNVIVIAWL